MKCIATFFLLAIAIVGQAQTVTSTNNRDTAKEFPTKQSFGTARILGPIYKQTVTFNYDNPFPALTEASVYFELPQYATLSDFGYYFKDEFVPGRLMDKERAWHIYTGITKRNEDPGIATQKDRSSYHIQIYPLEPKFDLRITLGSIGFIPVQMPNVPDVTNINDQLAIEKQSDWTSNWGVNVYAETHRDGYTYVAGRLDRTDGEIIANLRGISDVYWMNVNTGTPERFFVGRKKGPINLRLDGINAKGRKVFEYRQSVGARAGNDVAKLWAHQKLARWEISRREDVVAFSLKYGVPSAQTALLAVPENQMEQFRKLDAEFRARQRQAERERRNWQNQRRQNWTQSGGGDPELRIELPGALEATAMLPDGRAFALRPTGGNFWGGNYDIPAEAKEGQYEITIKVLYPGGRTEIRTVKYAVDRTPPKGRLTRRNGQIELISEPKLARVTAILADESEVPMEETAPGRYTLKGHDRVDKVVLMDDAHNLAEVKWSSRS